MSVLVLAALQSCPITCTPESHGILTLMTPTPYSTDTAALICHSNPYC